MDKKPVVTAYSVELAPKKLRDVSTLVVEYLEHLQQPEGTVSLSFKEGKIKTILVGNTASLVTGISKTFRKDIEDAIEGAEADIQKVRDKSAKGFNPEAFK